ncbi:MAG TPA: PH domain-containing protein [Rhodanobacteraceae bacterium]|nr:PH domain-containing protein [Rhodanobacteraceae bacterium]
MTNASRTGTLPLEGNPSRVPAWLWLLLFGVPAVVIVATFGVSLARGAPTWPVLIAGAFALAVSALAMLWILHMLRRIAVRLDGDALAIDAGAARRRFPLATLRAGGVRIVDLAAHAELRPFLRTWGIGMPGLASGWFRLRNGGKAFCILTRRERVAVLRADDGTWILLSLADAAPLRAAIGAK